MINLMEVIHESGYVYNDLKLHNIMLDYNVGIPKQKQDPLRNIFQDIDLKLVDFGLASRWRDRKTGEHIEPSIATMFRGNLYFSSVNQLKCMKPSRRDDLHSLAYLLLFMINKGLIPSIDSIF